MQDKSFWEEYTKAFLEENAKINLISKNEEKNLWSKHICDSLGIEKFFEKYGSPKNLLDIGTGGGFPSVIIALNHPEIEVTGIDSISKKIHAVENIKSKLGIKNLHLICDRVENVGEEYDVVVSRAVADLKKVFEYAYPKIKKGGYFVAYKSLKAQEEISVAQKIINAKGCKVIEIIDYSLPTEEPLTRKLIIIKKG